MDPLKDFLDAVAVAVDRAQVLASTAELAAEARGADAEQPTRDPRIDPRPLDVVRWTWIGGTTFVLHVADGQVWYVGTYMPLKVVTLAEWRIFCEGAAVITIEEGVRDV